MNKASPSTSASGAGLRARLNMEVVIAVLISLLAIAAILGSRDFPTTGLSTDVGSARFPLIHSVALLVLCAILIFQNLRKKASVAPVEVAGDESSEHPTEYLKVFFGILASVLCLAAMPYFGYAPSSVVYLSFLMWLLGMRHKALNPVLAIAITAVIYFTFSAALHVPLPLGSFFE